MVSNLKQKRGKSGSSTLFATRNQALAKLQLRLPDFRRLCILKGVHPREPRRKTAGQNKTYYHVKDIAFLAHEPLLAAFRAARSHRRKVRRALAKGHAAGAARLQAAAPRYALDHLVRERYPSFADALRDVDDPLTLTHLFAALPAERAHAIPAERVHTARRLSLEFQAYVALTGGLRKAFISVKGIYFQAEVCGETVTWLVPHALSQVLPADVDYRVMLTFLEFYEALLGFVNFKLYHALQLSYPPVLDRMLDEDAAGVLAVRTATRPDAAGADAGRADDAAELDAALQGALGHATADADAAGHLFRGCIFFLGRETPRDALSFLIRACGGAVAWDSERSPHAESDPAITHQVVDRPTLAGARVAGREYVQPQWLFDSLNFRIRCPTAPYAPGAAPPPHLSPFVPAGGDGADGGYAPDFADTVAEWQAAAAAAGGAARPARVRAGEAGEAPAAAGAADAGEAAYAAELAAELAGVPFSAAGDAAPAPRARATRSAAASGAPAARLAAEAPGSEAEAEALTHVLLPRKQKELYKAMQMGRAKKEAAAGALKARKAAVAEAGKR